MKILVVDVAAEMGGALTILNQFIGEFTNDFANQYCVVLSKPVFKNRNNIQFINLEWVKKSYIHRLFFDNIYIRSIIRKFAPDLIISLQNKGVAENRIPQDIYFQNALPLATKKFLLSESRHLWIYQNLIGPMCQKSLQKASHVYVQAEWIKKQLSSSWGIEEKKIIVKRPVVDKVFEKVYPRDESVLNLFYPANGSVYKNHEMLLVALKRIWDHPNGAEYPTLLLTGDGSTLSQSSQEVVFSGKYPVCFVGKLNRNQMIDIYNKSALVFPSYIETIGLPLMEAKALGCYILAANCEYAHEAIGEYKKVIYYDPFSPDTIEEVIRSYIKIWKGKTNEDTNR